jgi:hypothetical protein
LLASTLTDWLNAVGALGAACFALVGLALAFWQLPRISRQLKLSADTNVAQAYGAVSDRMASFHDILAADRAAFDPYFYGNAAPDDPPTPGREAPSAHELELVCEAIVDFADVCVEERKCIAGAEMDWSTWDAYFRFIYQNSPALRAYLRDNTDFYPDYITAVFGFIVVREEAAGEIVSVWEVAEDPDGLKGYPWMRTWILTSIHLPSGAPTGERLVAAVNRPDARAPSLVEVACRWEGVSEEERAMLTPALHSWVLGQLAASTRLRTARIRDSEGADVTYRLEAPAFASARAQAARASGTAPPRERFLASRFSTHR